MTEFISRNHGHECYEIIIKTTNHEHYKATEDFARRLIDYAKPQTNPDRDHATLLDALSTFGPSAQTLMVMEEMAELQKALCKHARGADNTGEIAEEIADVRIMLDQMEILHGCREQVQHFREQKIERLRQKIEQAKEGTAP